jgi:hypothetical protein
MPHYTHPKQEPLAIDSDVLRQFIADVEARDFRTNHDTGATENALCVWNKVRALAGMEWLKLSDLPQFCVTCKKYHACVINPLTGKIDVPS